MNPGPLAHKTWRDRRCILTITERKERKKGEAPRIGPCGGGGEKHHRVWGRRDGRETGREVSVKKKGRLRGPATQKEEIGASRSRKGKGCSELRNVEGGGVRKNRHYGARGGDYWLHPESLIKEILSLKKKRNKFVKGVLLERRKKAPTTVPLMGRGAQKTRPTYWQKRKEMYPTLEKTGGSSRSVEEWEKGHLTVRTIRKRGKEGRLLRDRDRTEKKGGLQYHRQTKKGRHRWLGKLGERRRVREMGSTPPIGEEVGTADNPT